MMCGHSNVDMGIWSSWSFLRFAPESRLFIHSDGTLKTEDILLWKTIIKNAEFTQPHDRSAAAAALLGSAAPLLSNWRLRHLYAPKLIDFHAYGTSEQVTLLDSDVLCFSNPRELLPPLGAKVSTIRWNNDLFNSYIASPNTIENALGRHLPRNFNSGLLTVKRWRQDDISYIEQTLSQLKKAELDIEHFWCEQTLYASVTALHERAEPLPPTYDIHRGSTRVNSPARHYVGTPNIRPRFFLEGVPKILSSVSERT